MNGLPQFWQAFQKGYTRLLLKCLCKLEYFSSAAFNDATMISGDNLLSKISDKTIGGIAVFIFNYLQNRLVTVFAVFWVIAQY
ncbi:MAG: hypothetical protein BWY95_02236 [Bacteroidetes bacterium ADurb.BinA104]|nr:MAG: hypothetical protein BWY95_02236 [Bacteroidetes bacterium ADurb.BinA104]